MPDGPSQGITHHPVVPSFLSHSVRATTSLRKSFVDRAARASASPAGRDSPSPALACVIRSMFARFLQKRAKTAKENHLRCIIFIRKKKKRAGPVISLVIIQYHYRENRSVPYAQRQLLCLICETRSLIELHEHLPRLLCHQRQTLRRLCQLRNLQKKRAQTDGLFSCNTQSAKPPKPVALRDAGFAALCQMAVLGCGFSLPVCGFVRTFD